MLILHALLFFVLGTFAMAIPISQTNDSTTAPNIYQRGFGSPSRASSPPPPSSPPSKFDASGYWIPLSFQSEVVDDVIYIIRDPGDGQWYAYPLNPSGTTKSAKTMAAAWRTREWEIIVDTKEFFGKDMWKEVVPPVPFQPFSYDRLSIDDQTGKISATNPKELKWTQDVVFDDKEKLPGLLESLKKKEGSAPVSH